MLKKILFTTAGLLIITILSAQTWKTQIYGISDKANIKTLKIKPEMSIDLRTVILDTDTLKLTRRYNGSFIGVTGDSMKIKLTDFHEFSNHTNGTIKQTTIPGKSFIMSRSSDTALAIIPLSDISYISFKPENLNKMAGIAEAGVFVSIFALVLAPLICFDYKDGVFLADRYKYWGLGSTIGLAGSFCLEGIFSSSKQYQFKSNWPYKKKKVWSFKSN